MTHSLRKFSVLLLLLMVPFFGAQPAKAQLCETLYEVITTLRPPTFGFPTVWDAKYSKKNSLVQLGSGVALEGGTVFAMGRRLSKEDFQPQEILLVELNRRGRALKEERYPAKPGEEPVKMIRMDKGYVALSNIRGGNRNSEKWVRLSWYDDAGKYKKEQILKGGVFDYSGLNLVKATEKEGFIAILHAVNREDETDQNGILARFTPSGQKLWQRAYRPGIPNMLANLMPIDSKNYIATGRIRLDDGRMAGWAMKLGYDGAVHWQRTYPRGKFSVFHNAELSPRKSAEGYGFFLTGASRPYDEGPEAAWVMEISAMGETLWQRYYRRPDYDLNGRWLSAYDDGRLVMIMNAKAIEGAGGHNHIRMLTLSPRGVLINDEAYYEGREASATDFVHGWNEERVMTATIIDDTGMHEQEAEPIVVVGLAEDEESSADEDGDDEPQDPIHKGWVFIATALDPYEDPCKRHMGP